MRNSIGAQDSILRIAKDRKPSNRYGEENLEEGDWFTWRRKGASTLSKSKWFIFPIYAIAIYEVELKKKWPKISWKKHETKSVQKLNLKIAEAIVIRPFIEELPQPHPKIKLHPMALHTNLSTIQNRHLLPDQVRNSFCFCSLRPPFYDLSLDNESSHDMSAFVSLVLFFLEAMRVAFEVQCQFGFQTLLA